MHIESVATAFPSRRSACSPLPPNIFHHNDIGAGHALPAIFAAAVLLRSDLGLAWYCGWGYSRESVIMDPRTRVRVLLSGAVFSD